MKNQDTYKEVKTFTYDNMIVRVHIPELEANEREKRMKRIYSAAESLLKDTKI